jgi:hypothetical protein
MSTCSVKGCGKEMQAKGLCGMHRMRLLRHGDLNTSRPSDWGKKEKHPLYGAWREFFRKHNKSCCIEWKDFWVFVSDVGVRPSTAHVLGRLDDSAPASKSNFVWREKIVCKEASETSKEYSARYQREYRKLHPERVKATENKRRYGLASVEYNRMADLQAGLCLICKRPERSLDKTSGQPRSLYVDHCHTTGKIRGLLCTNCNQGIGSFFDSPEILLAAIRYLEDNSKSTNKATV